MTEKKIDKLIPGDIVYIPYVVDYVDDRYILASLPRDRRTFGAKAWGKNYFLSSDIAKKGGQND